ncbi:uncharacterized mitochondrial protein AtMg00810-like [Impatiens glandulifera]|uniref:uncharacterized mitochondrial protein AtMg00810-like n=1 Tax=Impatiens glandulifera TaxID=253017 RepID=UPI001FB06A68|nr:uncharacterized mitochondrial protein AtMg00810-like [Impatiens glandulifera]
MESCSVAATPMNSSSKLDKNDDGQSVDITAYRGLIGSLLYLTASQLDIQFDVSVCERFQVNLKLSHFIVVKRILKYFKGTQNVGLWYPKDSNFNLKSFLDVDYAGCKIDRKNTCRTCQFLGDHLILLVLQETDFSCYVYN